MFEIKITGNTANEIKKDVKELFRTFGIEEQEVTKAEKIRNKKAEKEQAKEVDDESGTDSNTQSNPGENTENDIRTTESAEDNTEEDKSENRPESNETTYTLEEVRAKAAALQRAGKRDLVKSIITGAGASRLTEVDSSKYPWMMECFNAGCLIEEV